MTERISNIFSKEEEKDRPSCLILSCCIAAFFTAAVCLLIGSVVTCLKVFNNSYVDVFIPVDLIIFTFIGLTAFYLSLGIGLVLYNRTLRRSFKNLFQRILRNYLPQYSIERRYLVRGSPGRTAVRRNRSTKPERTESDTSNLQKFQNPKPKTMTDIVSQEQFDEIFKSLSEDNFVRNRALRKYRPTPSDRGRPLPSQLQEVTEQSFLSSFKRDLNPYEVNSIPTDASGGCYVRKSVIQTEVTPTAAKYETQDPKNSAASWSQSIASQPDTTYVSLEIPETEAFPMTSRISLSIKEAENQANDDEKITFV